LFDFFTANIRNKNTRYKAVCRFAEWCEAKGLRDRPLIAITIYTFARMGAVLQMNGGDDFVQGRRGWIRLRVSNGALEGMNNTIKLVSHCSFGFRAVENFTAAVYTFNDF
jgi:hypothetical protein